MEKHVNEIISKYIDDFKTDIKGILNNENVDIPQKTMYQLTNYLDSYPKLALTKENFVRRKRQKHMVPYFDRCNANRANCEQCTRRKKTDSDFCGTHMKGQPHGIVSNNEDETIKKKKVVVWAQEIKGIHYYIDDIGNVYEMKDIQEGIENPRIRSKYKVENGDYILLN